MSAISKLLLIREKIILIINKKVADQVANLLIVLGLHF